MFEQSAIPVNCPHILIFLKHSACHTKNPDTHQWYRINSWEIKKNHNVAIFNDKTVNMVQLPPAGPQKANAIETFARLTTINSNTHVDQISNNSNNNPPINNMPLPNNQSSIFIDKFSQLTEELKNFTKLVASNLAEMAQAHKNMQEQTRKFIENAISQVLTKTQDTTVPTSATLNTNTQNITYASPPYNLHQTPTWHPTTECTQIWYTHQIVPCILHMNIRNYRHPHNQIALNNKFTKPTPISINQ